MKFCGTETSRPGRTIPKRDFKPTLSRRNGLTSYLDTTILSPAEPHLALS